MKSCYDNICQFAFLCLWNSCLVALPYTSDGQADVLEGSPATELGQKTLHDCKRCLLSWSAFYWTCFPISYTPEVDAGTVPWNHHLAARANCRTSLLMSKPNLPAISLLVVMQTTVTKELCLLWAVFDWRLPFRNRNWNGQCGAWCFHISKGVTSQTINLTVDCTSQLCHMSAAGRTFVWH